MDGPSPHLMAVAAQGALRQGTTESAHVAPPCVHRLVTLIHAAALRSTVLRMRTSRNVCCKSLCA
eukprot:scaffold34447_cov36-Tisochrysis_lutea.AAC.4